MSYNDLDYDAELQEEVATLLQYPTMTPEEAHVLAVGIVAPRRWDKILFDEGYTKADILALRETGIKKYLDGGGKDHWQG